MRISKNNALLSAIEYRSNHNVMRTSFSFRAVVLHRFNARSSPIISRFMRIARTAQRASSTMGYDKWSHDDLVKRVAKLESELRARNEKYEQCSLPHTSDPKANTFTRIDFNLSSHHHQPSPQERHTPPKSNPPPSIPPNTPPAASRSNSPTSARGTTVSNTVLAISHLYPRSKKNYGKRLLRRG